MITEYSDIHLFFECKNDEENIILVPNNKGMMPVVSLDEYSTVELFKILNKVVKLNGGTLKVVRFSNPEEVTELLKSAL